MEELRTSANPTEQEEMSPLEAQSRGFLTLLELDDIADKDIEGPDGVIIKGHEFIKICGRHALPKLVELRDADQDDPNIRLFRDGLRDAVLSRIRVIEPEAGN